MKLTALAAVAVLALAGCGGSGDSGAAGPTVAAPVVSQSATPEQATPTTEQPAIPAAEPSPTVTPKTRPSPVLDLVTDKGLCAADAEMTNLELNDAIAPLLGFSPVRRERTVEQKDVILKYKNAAFSRACPGRMS